MNFVMFPIQVEATPNGNSIRVFSIKTYLSKYLKHPACVILKHKNFNVNHVETRHALSLLLKLRDTPNLFLSQASVGATPCGCPREDLRLKNDAPRKDWLQKVFILQRDAKHVVSLLIISLSNNSSRGPYVY